MFETKLKSMKRRFEIGPNTAFNNDEGISFCMSAEPRDFETLRRYETTIERVWYRAIRECEAVQPAEEEVHNAPPEKAMAAGCSQAWQATTATHVSLSGYTPAIRTGKMRLGLVSRPRGRRRTS